MRRTAAVAGLTQQPSQSRSRGTGDINLWGLSGSKSDEMRCAQNEGPRHFMVPIFRNAMPDISPSTQLAKRSQQCPIYAFTCCRPEQ